MKVLIVMKGFFPGQKYGGPPVSVSNYITLMGREMDCYVVACNHDKEEASSYEGITDGWNKRGDANVLYLSDAEYGASMFEKIIIDTCPNYLYLQGLFERCVLPCLWLARRHNIQVVLAPRGELCAGAFRKRYKKYPYILLLRALGLLNNVIVQSTSEEESASVARFLHVPTKMIHLLPNIPSLPHGLPPRRMKQPGEGRLVFVSRILWKKNLLFAINLLAGVKGNVVFDIYGPKEDLYYWNECEEAIRRLPLNIRAEYKGELNHDDIHETFNQYDAFLFPTLSENYGHVIVEALTTGCAPIISDQTPWNDMNESGAGWAIPLNREDCFRGAIQEIVDMDEEAAQTKRKAIAEYLDGKLKLDELKKQYLSVFKK